MYNYKKLLQQKGFRATKARILALTFFYKCPAPVDAESLRKFLHSHKIKTDTATIYRIINDFRKAQIIRRFEFQEGKFRYELSSLPHHHHAICIKCKTIKDIEACGIAALEKNVKKSTAFVINSHKLEFFGLCQNCQ